MKTTCSSCGAETLWRITPGTKWMPLDPVPVATGNVRVRGTNCFVLGGNALDEARARGEQLYVSHFATCPNAAAHRKTA